MEKRIASRALSVILALMLVIGMLPVFGIGALADTTTEGVPTEGVLVEEVVAAIEAIGTDAITKENFNQKSMAIERARAEYNAWKADNEEAEDTEISNYDAFVAAQEAYNDFLKALAGVEYKSYSPEDLLAIAQETSVSGAPAEELAGVSHTGAAGALYEGIVTEYLGDPVYSFETKEQYATNNTNADAAYIYEDKAASNAGLRYCDNDAYIIYKFDLSKFKNLCVTVDICQNYVLEAAADPNGPWTIIADYGVIGGGTRIEGETNGQVYDIIFSDLGITGTGYVRLSNVGASGGWGGAIRTLTLREATLAGSSYLFNPGDRVRVEVDADITGAGANEQVLSATIANGSYSQSASVNGSDFGELKENTNPTYGYTYRTVSAQISLPENDATLTENLKKQGFTFGLSSAATVERKIYRIAIINETTGKTVLELAGQELLDAASAASTPAALNLMPKAYQTFAPGIAVRSYEGSDWFTVIDMRSSCLDEFGDPYMHAGDEIEMTVDLFIEGSDMTDLPGGNAVRLVAKLDKDPEDTTVGLVTDDQVIVSAADYNDAELMLDDEHYGEPYKRMVRTFVIPDDAESEEKVQTYGFKMLVGTHMLPKEDYPFRVYSITLYNISTDTVIMYADADSLNTTAAQGARELMVDDSILGGIVGKRANGYGDATLVNGGFETLPAGMYSYDFNYTTLGNNGSEKATISAVTEDGEVLNSRVITDYYNGVYKTNRLTFYVDEETRVGFKIDLHNNTDFYLKNVTLNQMLSAEEVAIHRVITAIEELPAVDALTLDDAGAVSSAKKLYDNLSDEQKAAIDISNVNKLNQAVEKIAQLEEQLERDKEAAAKVDEAINALPSLKDLAKADQSKIKEARDAYNALTDTQKPLVTTLSVLEAAEARMEKLLAASDEDISAAKAVDDMIDALPAEDELEYADKADVDAARAAYDKLTEAQKGLVLGLETLKAAEEKIADLAPDVTYGDVNNDGKIDASDALEALQHSVELKTLEGDAFTAADVTNDSKVDATDALNILQYSVELIDHFPVEE